MVAQRARTTTTDDVDDVAFVSESESIGDQRAHPEVIRAVRYLLHRHELSTNDPLPQIIAVVGATGGEGVTTVSRALAEILASGNHSKVCWVDFAGNKSDSRTSLRSPAPELPASPRALHAASTTAPASKPDESPVRLIPAPNVPAKEFSDLAATPELIDLLDDLASEFRYIVFDMPPLLSEHDTLGFLRHADAYIHVARQGATSINEVKTVARELRTLQSLGAILNQNRTRTPRFLRRLLSG